MPFNFQRVTSRAMRIASASIVAISTYLFYLRKKQEADQHNKAYTLLAMQIKKRSSAAEINTLFSVKQTTKMEGNSTNWLKTRESVEPIAYMQAMNSGAPILLNKDGSESELNQLSFDQWPDFVNSLSGKVVVTFGFRKAFSATHPSQSTHAVIYVRDENNNHAFFGYYKNNEKKLRGLEGSFLINDAHHKTILAVYTLHSELSIAGNKSQVKDLFELIEVHAKARFTGWTMNCYTPLIAGLIDAKKLGFSVPDFYRESLLVVIPKERNYGAGILPNSFLGRTAKEVMKDIQENKIITSTSSFEKGGLRGISPR